MPKQNRTEVERETLYGLSPKQEPSIDLILEGKTDSEVAESVGVTRPTVNLWRNRHPAFIAEVNRRRHSLAAARHARLESLLDELLSATIDLVQQREPSAVMRLAKLLLPSMLAGVERPGITDAREVLRQAPGGVHVEKLLADLNKASPAELSRAEDTLLRELAVAKSS